MSVSSASPRAGALGKAGRRARRAPRWLAIPLGACIALGGYGVWHATQSSATSAVTISTATVSRGTLTASVAGSGTVEASSSRTLSFPVSGTVSEVLVAVGDAVKAGQPLARVDTAELELAVRQAQANLASAQAQVAAANGEGATAEAIAAAEAQLASAKAQYNQTVTGGTTASQLASARAQLVSAQAQLDDLLAGATDAELAAAQAQVAQARLALQAQRTSLAAAKTRAESAVATAANTLRDAQDSYSTLYWQNRQLEKAPGELPQSNQDAEAAAQRAVANAEEGLKQAQVVYEQARADEVTGVQQAEADLASAQRDLRTLQDGATDAELASARASVASAQANLSSLEQGGTADEKAIAQASVDQAQINLDQLTRPGSAATVASAAASLAQAEVALAEARQDLADATIVAPFDGVVAAVSMSAGDTVSTSTTLTVLDPAKLYVELSMSESDVAGVAVGQKVELTFDALPDARLTGAVTSVAPAATVASNVATYPVRVSFEPGDQPIKVGMSVSGAIITAEHADVILVPSRAVQTQGEQQVVRVQQAPGAAPATVVVETGLASAGQTEIVSVAGGATLGEGDVLVVTSSGTGSSSSGTASGGSLLGGFGGPPPGGPPPGN